MERRFQRSDPSRLMSSGLFGNTQKVPQFFLLRRELRDELAVVALFPFQPLL